MDRKPFNRGGEVVTAPSQQAREQSFKAAERRLKEAVAFAKMSIKTPMFQKRMGTGNTAVWVRFEWPGLLSVLDPVSGRLLAVSEIGKPEVLRADFLPPITGVL